ncbi:MAG: hypothetical protein A3F84_25275 [Candidatus Handelsmanbacteria bacterium RIFCSPLOWO2_12_FULL_64_10]|uniref:Uncharacterized protein n=1 Tax=Handelsmanbacteria sp. (strain RIFCSPLOWO2_12_FULL_64_10) TaxID=1817868 RepID=A0A1F6CW92_HANXR|nr:MAG: hypothetical protein A3F84_25275 [Candidatus Handelsmanbacteria bacterium RIFCSPLOWO2_12_FULL_64_10]
MDMRRVNVFLGLAAACVLLAVVGVAQAQYNPDTVPLASNSRALIQNSWNNMGISGCNQDWVRGAMRNDFPANGVTGPGYYGIVLSQFSSNQKSQHYNSYRVSGGEGIWIVTPDGKMSITGPRMTSWVKDYVRAIPYDPKGAPEEKWGVSNIMGSLSPSLNDIALSNYFPGVGITDIGSLYANQMKGDLTAPALIGNYRLHGYIVDPKLPEETVIARWTNTKQGITTTRRVYNWSNPDFDKFYLMDLTFTNSGDFNGDGKEDNPGQTKTLDGVYFAFENAEVPGAMENLEAYGWDFWVNDVTNFLGPDDITLYTDASNYAGAFKGLGLKTSISRDSDHPLSFWDDTGGPFYKARVPTAYDILQTEGQLRAPSTYGFAPIAYRNAGASHTFNYLDKGKYVDPVGDQPFAVKWWKVRSKSDFDDLYPENASEAQLRTFMFTPGIMDNPNEANPDDRKMYIYAQVYGPYTLQPGESAKLIFAVAAGHPSQLKPDSKQGMGVMDIVAWDRSEDPVTTKQNEMKTLGEKALLENIQLARFAYEANLQVPAAPTNTYIPGDWLTASPDAHQQISWIDAADRAVNPYYNEADVLGYRVYRSTWFNWGPWELRDVIEKGKAGQSVTGKWTYADSKYTYEDLESAAGFEYHFSVRPYAKGHAAWTSGNKSLADIPVARVRSNVTKGYESGWGASTARTYDGDNRRPFQPPTPEGDRLERKVTVVPNPYFVDGKHQYPNSKMLRFVNLPQKCKIYIFSESGDRIETLQQNETIIYDVFGNAVPKTAGKKGERNFSQVAWNLSGDIMTGIYYFVVVNEMPGYEGKTQRGAFVVIK